MKNKKNQKKFQRTIYITWLNFSEKNFFTKIEKRQRSIRRPKRGCGYNVVTRLQKHVRSGRIVFIFAVLFVETRAYNVETTFLWLFAASVRFLLACAVCCAICVKIRAKTCFASHGRCIFAFGVIVLCCLLQKYTLNV